MLYAIRWSLVLQSFVSWAAGAFGAGPADIIKGTFPLAGLAMQTIGRIGGFNLAVNGFIYAGWAESNAGAAE